jgi:photosystem II stability/assembly factor-like uncharacterized protein
LHHELTFSSSSSPPGFSPQPVSTPNDLYTVSFAKDLSYGVTAGKGHTIWETKDRGSTWSIAPQCGALAFDTFYALHLSSSSEGFGAGIVGSQTGAAYKNFGGYSWVCGPTSYPQEIFYDVVRLGGRVWIVGDTGGKIYRRENESAPFLPLSFGQTLALRGLWLSGTSLGVAVGAKGTIVRSDDGWGNTWKTVPSPVAVDLYDVFFWDTTRGWAVGAAGTLLSTTDGGKSWKVEPTPTTRRLEGICFSSISQGWAIGEQGTVLHTTAPGQ